MITAFLDEHMPVRARLPLPPGLTMRGLYLGQGNLGLEILVLDAQTEPRASTIRQVWKERLKGARHRCSRSRCTVTGR